MAYSALHVQDNKQDPGPALQWDKVINGARALRGEKPLPPGTPSTSRSSRWHRRINVARAPRP